MNRSSEPLSAEERALAERLARLDVRREPSPALDAAILAAARAAVKGVGAPIATASAAIATVPAATTAVSAHGSTQGDSNEGEDEGVPNAPPKVVPLRPRKPLARLPLGLSLAASLVLAAGIGWRLADGGGSESALEGASAQKAVHEEQVAYSADAADATEAVILEPEMNRVPPPPPPPPLDSIESQRREVAMAPSAPEREAKRTSSSSERDSEFVMDEGVAHHSNESADAAAGAFPAEPIAQPAPLGNAVAAKPALAGGASDGYMSRARDKREAGKDDRAAESLDKATVTGARLARQAPAAAPPPAAQAPAAPAASAVSIADQPFDDQPPVSADSPEFRQAWLQRIRNLFAKGQADAGRTSLQEFRRRYPDSELPDDLKKIAATLPPPAP